MCGGAAAGRSESGGAGSRCQRLKPGGGRKQHPGASRHGQSDTTEPQSSHNKLLPAGQFSRHLALEGGRGGEKGSGEKAQKKVE